jgi:hypothetical protein
MVVSKLGNRMERGGLGWIYYNSYMMYDSDGVSEYAKLPRFMPVTFAPPRPMVVRSWQEIRLG